MGSGSSTDGAGGGAPSRGGSGVLASLITSRASWQAPPSMNSCSFSSQMWNGMSVVGPSTTYSSSARSMRLRAVSRSTSHAMSLATMGSYWSLMTDPACTPESTRMPGPAGSR